LRILALCILAGPPVRVGAGIAAALGAFRAYLAASAVYVAVAVALIAILVPALGLPGAALAMTGGAFVRQAGILLVLRRMGFPRLPRLWAAWLCALAAVGIGWWLDPGRALAAILVLVLCLAFAWLGRVTLEEIRVTMRRLLPGH
jgi:O-antigen/teichoic acid export membrane protein